MIMQFSPMGSPETQNSIFKRLTLLQ